MSISVNYAECCPIISVDELLKWNAEQSCHMKSCVPLNSDHNCLDRLPGSRGDNMKVIHCHDLKGGYVDDRFLQGCGNMNNYAFSNWHLIDIFVYFSHNRVTPPPPSWTNAAHRHGVSVLGTFITEWQEGYDECRFFLADVSSYTRVADKLVDFAISLGFEGWLINIENEIEPCQLPNLVAFVDYLRRKMAERLGQHSMVIWYDSVIFGPSRDLQGKLLWQNQLNQLNGRFFDVSDGIFLNYSWHEKDLMKSASYASKASTLSANHAAISPSSSCEPSSRSTDSSCTTLISLATDTTSMTTSTSTTNTTTISPSTITIPSNTTITTTTSSLTTTSASTSLSPIITPSPPTTSPITNQQKVIAACNRRTVYVGIDVFGRTDRNLRGSQSIQLVKEILDHKLSCALFAPSWTFETADSGVYDDYRNKEHEFWSKFQEVKLTSTQGAPLLADTLLSEVSLPFTCHCCQGSGKAYHWQGQRLSREGFDLSMQSVQVPYLPWRTKLHLFHDDAYNGFSSYRFTNTAKMLRVKLPQRSSSPYFLFTFAYRENPDANIGDVKSEVRLLIEDGGLAFGRFTLRNRRLHDRHEINDRMDGEINTEMDEENTPMSAQREIYEREMDESEVDAFYGDKRPRENGRWRVKFFKIKKDFCKDSFEVSVRAEHTFILGFLQILDGDYKISGCRRIASISSVDNCTLRFGYHEQSKIDCRRNESCIAKSNLGQDSDLVSVSGRGLVSVSGRGLDIGEKTLDEAASNYWQIHAPHNRVGAHPPHTELSPNNSEPSSHSYAHVFVRPMADLHQHQQSSSYQTCCSQSMCRGSVDDSEPDLHHHHHDYYTYLGHTSSDYFTTADATTKGAWLEEEDSKISGSKCGESGPKRKQPEMVVLGREFKIRQVDGDGLTSTLDLIEPIIVETLSSI